MKYGPAYQHVMSKVARENVFDWGRGATGLSALAGTMFAGAVMKKAIDSIMNDTRRKSIVEDLALNDPILKTIPKKQLLEWYATIKICSPTISVDKSTVRELLHGFAKFGKADIQTVKLLTDMEKNLSTGQDKMPLLGML